MSVSKSSATTVVGRRLRRYLGALLALGFGTAWWSFVTPEAVAATVPVVTTRVSLEPVATPHVIGVAKLPTIARRAQPVRRRRPRPVVAPVASPEIVPVITIAELTPVIEPPPIVETPPVLEPRIITRSS